MTKILILQLFIAIASYFLSLRYLYTANLLVSSINLYVGYSLIKQLKDNQYIFELKNLLFLDALNGLLIMIILTLSFLVGIYSIFYMEKERENGLESKKINEFYFYMNTFIFVMLLLAMSNNFGILWIAIEGTTLATAFLISFYKNKEAIEAGWKYIILCSIGIGLGLFGVIILYFASFHILGEGLDALNYTNIYMVAKELNTQLLILAFIFFVVGFGTKVGFAPLHFWLPDAHSQAPTPISALMSGVLLNCAFYSIIRVESIINHNTHTSIVSNMLIFFGVFTVFVSALFIIKQSDYKRLLAYSSMEHMGLIAFAFGLNTKLGIMAGIFHMLNHSLAKTSIFMNTGNILLNLHTREFENIKGLFRSMPYTSVLLILSVVAITGTPPFSLFISKMFMIVESFRIGYIGLAVFIMSLLAVIFTGFIYQFVGILGGDSEKRYRENLFLLAPSAFALLSLFILMFYMPESLKILIERIPDIVGVDR